MYVWLISANKMQVWTFIIAKDKCNRNPDFQQSQHLEQQQQRGGWDGSGAGSNDISALAACSGTRITVGLIVQDWGEKDSRPSQDIILTFTSWALPWHEHLIVTVCHSLGCLFCHRHSCRWSHMSCVGLWFDIFCCFTILADDFL